MQLKGTAMQTIKATEFKAKCLELIDDVFRTRHVLVVTKNGKPVVELHPFSGRKPVSPFGLHPSVQIKGDLIRSFEKYD